MKKSKLKLFSITLAAMMFILNFTFIGVNAASNTVTYEIPELSMTMDIPTSIKIITQGIKQSDPIFSTETFDYIQIMSKIRDNDDYFYGKDSKGSFEFEVAVTENLDKIENLTKLSEKKQNAILETFSQQSDVIDSSFYKTDTGVFIEASRSINNSEGRFFSKEYYTIYDSYNITVKLSSNNDNLTNQELDLLKSVVDSMSFPKEKTVNLSVVLSKSELFSFCLIIVSFVVLVISKIQSIKKEQYRAERKQNRMKQRMERDEKEKQAAAAQQATSVESSSAEQKNNTTTDATIVDNSSGNEATEKKVEAEDTSNNKAGESENSNSTVNLNQHPQIDLDAAIANFEDTSEARKKRQSNEQNKKKFKLPFGKIE